MPRHDIIFDDKNRFNIIMKHIGKRFSNKYFRLLRRISVKDKSYIRSWIHLMKIKII